MLKKRYKACFKHSPHSDESSSTMSPSAGHKDAARKDGNSRSKVACRPKLEEPDTGPMFPRPPFRQTPGPIWFPKYTCKLILERWEAEVKACENAKKLQLIELVPGTGTPSLLQASLRRLVSERWDAEVKRCEEAKGATFRIASGRPWYFETSVAWQLEGTVIW
ncbi:uncharacterized protein HD556DRAFT_1311171 [Suillus plorans]|uniref:Uncharacterized protein n=1 Tax=Suillus plorans TaxID=116603 RepID=A0A9P7AH97_9AGAM|nr:uncharacterized protein HD556DRAFT_1315170 [Suillus plorans]XP_041152104.1 uncharacterized protein HD556DRAFT_1314945 [Suillus plorans]XP_041154284.1 uncharacterized protein HD556DRAFT_1313220 [Suillus plorans]XP_041155550.1 uncharacterized protein HD556DRAFT_1312069 [Suillus plorans]XP_041156817.1 uncharacterized protein HD556DRAFT_1311171 [Suillus plorans]KAG1784332.1 hypothetical protein HD556DRAFT_1315170 [Suillus plorans]KAG1784619.1 hypothetical protein HD556DRAFT_1314945 [Suillus pl